MFVMLNMQGPIRPLCAMNKVIKAKWLWKFAKGTSKGDDALWKNVIEMKHKVGKFGLVWQEKSICS